MRRCLGWRFALALSLPGASAWAAACPAPPQLALTDLRLPAAKAAVLEQKRLVVLVIGGAASAGTPAHGAAFAYPARLQAHLRERLPGVEVSVVQRAAPRRAAHVTVDRLDADMAQTGARLVIWGAGAIEAGQRVKVQTLTSELDAGISKVAAAHADLLLMDLQFAPTIARLVDLTPYRDATRSAGAARGIAVLDRYELMRWWNDNGTLNLDATDPKERVGVARRLYDCLAGVLADGIAAAVR